MKLLLRSQAVLLALVLELIAIVPLAQSAPSYSLQLPPSSPANQLNRSDRLLARDYRRSPRRRPYPRWGAPAWSTGGAARGGCNSQESPLIPLVPVVTDTGDKPSFFGTTVSERPTFFAYVPKTNARQVEFLLLDEEAGVVISETILDVSGLPQIIGFKLDKTLPPLAIGKNYKWFFTTLCNPKDVVRDDNSGNPSISGLIQRVEFEPGLASQLHKAAPISRPQLYAEAGAWFDALATLSQLRCQKPKDAAISARWSALLESMELEHIPELMQLMGSEKIDQAPLAKCGG
ncbi:MAG: DUF928 domain-containing protein [Scytolyngbya sp. HA4215-MV1]|jgi:hypothetical protein|nr:DUF928 domain-containing protein [Scytolyngbya sp. HA4215-MV1]